MKKSTFYLICFGVLLFFSFVDKPKFPANVTPEEVSLFNNEFIETIHNETLNATLEEYFVRFIDDVTSVDVQFSEVGGYYYYIAFGTKNKQDVVQLLKIEKEDYLNQTYTYIDFSKVSDFNAIEICYTGTLCPGCNRSVCCVSCNIACGLWDGHSCHP